MPSRWTENTRRLVTRVQETNGADRVTDTGDVGKGQASPSGTEAPAEALAGAGREARQAARCGKTEMWLAGASFSCSPLHMSRGRSFIKTVQAMACLMLAALVCAACAPRSTGNYALEDVRNLAALRQEALSLVNQARREQGVAALRFSGPLNAAAQAHAEDMARRGYYGHYSPERQDVAYRYRAHGGGRWSIIAENIARCNSCAPNREQLRRFQQGWMRSPGHQRNILDPRVAEFGFGMASAGGSVFAVQTFVTQRD